VIRPGEVYISDFDEADFDEAGPHPIIVVSREALNRGRYAVAVVCTSARFAVRGPEKCTSPLTIVLPNWTRPRLARIDEARLKR
jgi:mRNA-degrading endonuclease toxin of MazEF toxin-antitoxin module